MTASGRPSGIPTKGNGNRRYGYCQGNRRVASQPQEHAEGLFGAISNPSQEILVHQLMRTESTERIARKHGFARQLDASIAGFLVEKARRSATGRECRIGQVGIREKRICTRRFRGKRGCQDAHGKGSQGCMRKERCGSGGRIRRRGKQQGSFETHPARRIGVRIMPAIANKTHKTKGHPPHGPFAALTASPNVNVDGSPVLRNMDEFHAAPIAAQCQADRRFFVRVRQWQGHRKERRQAGLRRQHWGGLSQCKRWIAFHWKQPTCKVSRKRPRGILSIIWCQNASTHMAFSQSCLVKTPTKP